MIIILIVILLLFICFQFFLKENFQNQCNPFFKGKTFCSFNNDSNQCECTYQKDSVHIPYTAPENCCNYKCIQKTREECNKPINKQEASYYCYSNRKCQERKGTIWNSHISANNCGTDPLNNQLLLPFLTKKECEKSLSPCDKYNDERLSTSEKKAKCLTNPACGFCTNPYGYGKCMDGTAEAPNDFIRYPQCVADPSTGNKYKYEYGDFLEFLF